MSEGQAIQEPVSHPAPTAPRRRRQTVEMPRVRLTRRRLVASIVFVVSVPAFLYFVLPKLLGLQETWNRIQHGDPWWFALAAILEVLSFVSYVALFKAVLARGIPRVGWRESYEITMASLAATRLFAAAGAGGIALSAWALRRAGLGPRTVAARIIAFLVLLYGVYMGAFVIDGLGLYTGVLPGPHPFAITVVPAIFGAVVITIFLGAAFLRGDPEAFVRRWATGEHWAGRLARRAAALPATVSVGVRMAIGLIRTRDPYLLGAVGWWGFDIAVLWACFHAFGNAPPKAVIVMAYFVGMLGNTLPLPGGIGGVDGGMIGAFTAFGVDVELAVVSVLAYRAFAFWLPTVPGGIAYFQLRRTVHRWRAAEAAPSYT
ncbi:MAG TPA: lysylphosphatidylglycerol synthase transmembrane domain-containing protein [Solirubrobacteraceae bacterium]|nr:lysylphosphatidylglycerol synthase transmembrane domain-containing protein [Solirubrobacteraceae bacterium]